MRYVVNCNIHEGLDPEEPILVIDALAVEQNRSASESEQVPEMIHVADLWDRLPSDIRKEFRRS